MPKSFVLHPKIRGLVEGGEHNYGARSIIFHIREPLINLAITSVFGGQGDHGQIPATVDRFPYYFRGIDGYLVPFETQFTCQA